MDNVQPIRDAHWLRYGKGVRRGGGGGGGHGGGGGGRGGGGMGFGRGGGGGFGRGWHGGWGHRGWGGRGLGGGWGWGYPYYWDYPAAVVLDQDDWAVRCAARSSTMDICEATGECVMYGGACIPRR